MEDPISAALLQRKSTHGITFEELALEMGLHRNTVSSMARGFETDTIFLKRLAEFFQWDLAEIGLAVMFDKRKVRKKRKGKK